MELEMFVVCVVAAIALLGWRVESVRLDNERKKNRKAYQAGYVRGENAAISNYEIKEEIKKWRD